MALMDPNTCTDCHPNHAREWASSMHAYASRDPIFRAMNARGQAETDGALGSFCVDCHAPMAVHERRTTNGDNLDELGPEYQGVTCYFCHNVEAVADVHDNPLGLPANNPLVVAGDDVMRGGLPDPRRPPAHDVAYSAMHDAEDPASSQLCGPCHDIVNDNGVHLERTFAEWSVHREAASTTCAGCHMQSYTGVAAQTDLVQVPLRKLAVHRHLMPGVDTALTDFPDRELQRRAIACELRNAVRIRMAVEPGGLVKLQLETDIGHGWPSGASQDRRAWLELRAFDASGREIYSEGVVADDEAVPAVGSARAPLLLRDYLYDADEQPVHMFWEADTSQRYPKGYESYTLPPNVVGEEHTKQVTRQVPQAATRVAVRLRIRAIGHDLIDELVTSGHLGADVAKDYKSQLVTHTLGSSVLIWERDRDGAFWIEDAEPNDMHCPSDWQALLGT